MKKEDVTAKMLADYIVKLADGRKASDSEIKFVEENFNKFQFTVEQSFVTKNDELTMSRAQLNDNCDLLNL